MKGKQITMYLDGGWKAEGKLVRKDEEKFFLENDGDVYMVFKDKVSCILINNDEKNKKQIVAKTQEGYDKNRELKKEYSLGREYSGLESGMSGVSLPSDILLGDSDSNDNDFSVSFGPSTGLSDNKIKVNITSEE